LQEDTERLVWNHFTAGKIPVVPARAADRFDHGIDRPHTGLDKGLLFDEEHDRG